MPNLLAFKETNPYYLSSLFKKSNVEDSWLIAKLLANPSFNLYIVKTPNPSKHLYIESSSGDMHIYMVNNREIYIPKITFNSALALLYYLSDELKLLPENLIIPSKNNAYNDYNLMIDDTCLNEAEQDFLKEMIKKFHEINKSNQEIMANLRAFKSPGTPNLLNDTKKILPSSCTIELKPRQGTDGLFFRANIFDQEKTSDNQVLLDRCAEKIQATENNKIYTWYAQISNKKGISFHYLNRVEKNGQSILRISHKQLDLINEQKFSNAEQFFQICESNGFSRSYFLSPADEFAVKTQENNTEENFFALLHTRKSNIVYDISDAWFIHKMLKYIEHTASLATGVERKYWLISTKSDNKDALIIIASTGIIPIKCSNADKDSMLTEIITLIKDQQLNFENMLVPQPTEACINSKLFSLIDLKRKIEIDLKRKIEIELKQAIADKLPLIRGISTLNCNIDRLKKEILTISERFNSKKKELSPYINLAAEQTNNLCFRSPLKIQQDQKSLKLFSKNKKQLSRLNVYIKQLQAEQVTILKDLSSTKEKLSECMSLKDKLTSDLQYRSNQALSRISLFRNSLSQVQHYGNSSQLISPWRN